MHLEMSVNGVKKDIQITDPVEKNILDVIKRGYRLWAPVVDVKYQDDYNDYTTVRVFDHEMNAIGTGVLVV